MDVELLGNLGHRSVALADGCKRHLRLEGRGVIPAQPLIFGRLSRVKLVLRDRLLGEIVAITSAEQATNWARNAITSKNSLIVADAEAIEQAFERRLTELSEAGDAEAELPSVQDQGSGKFPGQSESHKKAGGQSQAGQSSEIPCLICGRSHAFRPAPPPVCPTTGARPQGQ